MKTLTLLHCLAGALALGITPLHAQEGTAPGDPGVADPPVPAEADSAAAAADETADDPSLVEPPRLEDLVEQELAPDAEAAVTETITAEVIAATPVAAADPAAAAAAVEAAGTADGAPNELVLLDGRVLRDYRIHNWSKTALTIFHSTGAVNVPAHQLPENMVKAFGMDPQLSQKQEQESRTRRTEEATANLEALDERQALRKMPPVTVNGSVASVGSDGVLVEVAEPADLEGGDFQRIGGMIYDANGNLVQRFRGQIFGSVWVTGHPLQAAVVDGDILRFQGRVAGRRVVDGKTHPSVRFEKPAP